MKQSKANLQVYLRDNYLKLLKKDLMTISSAHRENLSLVWILKSMNLLGEGINST